MMEKFAYHNFEPLTDKVIKKLESRTNLTEKEVDKIMNMEGSLQLMLKNGYKKEVATNGRLIAYMFFNGYEKFLLDNGFEDKLRKKGIIL